MSSEKIRSINHISYQVITENLVFENLRTDTLNNFETAAPGDKFTGSKFRMDDKHTTHLYAGDQMASLFAKDSTYSIEKPQQSQYFRSFIYYWAGQFDRFLSYPHRLKSFPDTLILGKKSYHVRYHQKKDSLIGDHLTYHFHDIFIEQATLLPVLIISDLKLIYSDLPSRITSTYRYQHYTLNPVNFPDLHHLHIPEHYQDIKTKPVQEKAVLVPLKAGTDAPDFALADINGEELRLSELKNQVVLLSFTSVECPHAYSSMSGLKRINQKFGDKNLKIISIYDNISSPKDKVVHMMETFQLDFMRAILNGTPLATQYQSDAFPDFYLIEQNGKIAYYAGGYSLRIEEQLTEKIEKLLADNPTSSITGHPDKSRTQKN